MNDVPFDRARGDVIISTDRTRLDVDLVHTVLAGTYWAANIPREVVVRSIDNSLAFGIYEARRQVGFARVITDLATYAYLSDVFIIEERRGRGLGKLLVESIVLHPQLQGLRRFALFTRDAAALYERHGFATPVSPSGYMEILNRGAYGMNPAE
ncbi:MAG: GNAT family N-acetyltransferase [Gemmatimonadaceae bacterium]